METIEERAKDAADKIRYARICKMREKHIELCQEDNFFWFCYSIEDKRNDKTCKFLKDLQELDRYLTRPGRL